MAIIYDSEIRIEKLTLGPWESNCYVVSAGKNAIIIDAPAEAPKILEVVRGLSVGFILITHGHSDHLGALVELKGALNAPVAVHPRDAHRLPVPPDQLLEHGNEITPGKLKLKVIHTPGHTPGSVCFQIGQHLFAGDTIFPNGPGKTNSPQDLTRIISSLVQHVFVLPDETIIYSGHGEGTILGKEKQLFAIFNKRPRQPDLCGDVLWAP
ncbi:MAG: beta-lactamase domain protein [Dehalococcoidia bacterium]|nr:beta-lactamase domain protein [Dehalococcoidia bacterium]